MRDALKQELIRRARVRVRQVQEHGKELHEQAQQDNEPPK